jgi:hypothetical protein
MSILATFSQTFKNNSHIGHSVPDYFAQEHWTSSWSWNTTHADIVYRLNVEIKKYCDIDITNQSTLSVMDIDSVNQSSLPVMCISDVDTSMTESDTTTTIVDTPITESETDTSMTIVDTSMTGSNTSMSTYENPYMEFKLFWHILYNICIRKECIFEKLGFQNTTDTIDFNAFTPKSLEFQEELIPAHIGINQLNGYFMFHYSKTLTWDERINCRAINAYELYKRNKTQFITQLLTSFYPSYKLFTGSKETKQINTDNMSNRAAVFLQAHKTRDIHRPTYYLQESLINPNVHESEVIVHTLTLEDVYDIFKYIFSKDYYNLFV